MKKILLTAALVVMTTATAKAEWFMDDKCYISIRKREYDTAIEECTKQINEATTARKKSIAYQNRGGVYSIKGQTKLAIEDFTSAIKTDPENHLSYHNRGLAYSMEGRYGLAITDFTKAIKISPKFYDAYRWRGDTNFLKGDYEAAASDYEKASEINPKDEYIYIRHAAAAGRISAARIETSLDVLREFAANNAAVGLIRMITDLYLGAFGVTEKDVIAEAQKSESEDDRKKLLCLAYYYIAERRLSSGDAAGATEYFRKSADTGKKELPEYLISKKFLEGT